MKYFVFVLISVLSPFFAVASPNDWDGTIGNRYFDRTNFSSIPECADARLQSSEFPRSALCPVLDAGYVVKTFLESDGKEATYLVWKFYHVIHARFSIVAYIAIQSLTETSKPIAFKKITQENQQDDLPTLLQIVRFSNEQFKVMQLALTATSVGRITKTDHDRGMDFGFSLQ